MRTDVRIVNTIVPRTASNVPYICTAYRKAFRMRNLIVDEVCDGPEQDRRVVEYQLSDGSRVTPQYVATMIKYHGATFLRMVNDRWIEMKIVHNFMWADELAT